MVLLAGDLFHDNKPSRKALYQVMRSLRLSCLGDKPCELEMLSDANEVFDGAFNHVNYEDPDINVAIPVFSIHGNHDDPSGDGHFCSLDLLQVSGLLNYFGRTPESDDIKIKPVLLQKGQTKLALYGMSNVRDERLFRTFRDGKVTFFKPGVQQRDWFNLMAVHQNHHAHTETGYLPENFLPEFMDLVVWGHEHECIIDPKKNPETGFHVMQPGSSVATSLVPGEAVAKHIAIVSVAGKDFTVQKHRIKTVRPFVTREIILADEPKFEKLSTKKENKSEVTRLLMEIVEELIEEARAEWLEVQDRDPEDDEEIEIPLPLVRLKVEYSAPEGSHFDVENPQRFSNRFVGRVANVNDVIQFWRRKTTGGARKKKEGEAEMPDQDILESMEMNNIKVSKLVEEFLAAQSLQILPQAPFGDAVNQFVNKDDKNAMQVFVDQSLEGQVTGLLKLGDDDEEEIKQKMQEIKEAEEAKWSAGAVERGPKKKFVEQPDDYDSDLNGPWQSRPEAWETDLEAEAAAKIAAVKKPVRNRVAAITDDEDDDGMGGPPVITRRAPASRAPAKRALAKKAAAPRQTAAQKRTAEAAAKKNVGAFIDDSDDGVMVLDGPPAPKPAAKAPAKRAPRKAATPAAGTKGISSYFAQSQPPSQAPSQAWGGSKGKAKAELSDDMISSDDDDDPAFEDAPPPSSRRGRM